MTFPPTPGRADTGKLHLAFSSKANYEAKAATLRYGTSAAGECETTRRSSTSEPSLATRTAASWSGASARSERALLRCLPEHRVQSRGARRDAPGRHDRRRLPVAATGRVQLAVPRALRRGRRRARGGDHALVRRQPNLLGHHTAEAESDLHDQAHRGRLDPAKPGDVPAMIPTTSKLALTDSTVYFSGTVSSNTVPALVVVQFPNGVSKDDVVVPDARLNVGVVCGKPTTANRRVLVLCSWSPRRWSHRRGQGRILGALRSPRPSPGAHCSADPRRAAAEARQTARDWLSHNDTPSTSRQRSRQSRAPARPAGQAGGRSEDEQERHHRRVEKLHPDLRTVPEARPLAFSNVDIHIASTPRRRSSLTSSPRRSRRPAATRTDFTSTSITLGTLYSGFLEPPSTQGVRDAVTLELIPANAFSDHYPALCAGFAAQAKAPVLCGPYKNSVIVLGARTRLSISRSNGGWARTTDLRVISNSPTSGR